MCRMKTNESQVVSIQLDTQDLWSRTFNLSTRIRYPHVGPQRRMVYELISNGVHRKDSKRILDFGFGHGNLFFWFKPPTSIYGIDLSIKGVQNAAARAKRIAYPEYEFRVPVHSKSVAIEYPCDFFDIIVTSHTLEHVFDDEALISEFHRVLKSGGKVFLAAPKDVDHAKSLRTNDVRSNPAFPKNRFHVWMYNASTLKSLFETAGFNALKAYEFDSFGSYRATKSRPVRVFLSFFSAVVPYRIWMVADSQFRRKGYGCRQVILVARKPFFVENSNEDWYWLFPRLDTRDSHWWEQQCYKKYTAVPRL